ncbi:MAG: hypothetical protein OXE78_02375, partial [Gammaproteobacteria bacterium]|nr:hypothetical protein [Gammaproteobacteria bacterium]
MKDLRCKNFHWSTREDEQGTAQLWLNLQITWKPRQDDIQSNSEITERFSTQKSSAYGDDTGCRLSKHQTTSIPSTKLGLERSISKAGGTGINRNHLLLCV